MTELSQAEKRDVFELHETVDVPACGLVFPDGVQLQVHRELAEEPESPIYAVYAGTANGTTVAIAVAEFMETPLAADIFTPNSHESEHFGVKPNILDFGEGDSSYPFGMSNFTYSVCGSSSHMADSISEAVRRTAFLQGAARDVELNRRAREQEQGHELDAKQQSQGLSRD